MGYVVLHLDKSAGNESAMTDHIERKVIAPNVDPTRTHLNKELIDYPDGVNNRTEAIQHRIKNAGLTRQVGKNQVQVIRVILSGSTEDMLRIQAEGRLDEWCKDSIDYLKKEFGEKNVVAASLHLDEDAPHIHASIAPIVQGERRKKKSNKEPEAPKKQYKKKNVNRPRLCADDVMERKKLIEYQDRYAEAMANYGLQRGIRGSEARHISTSEHYRNLFMESEHLEKNIVQYEQQKKEAEDGYKQTEVQKRLKEAELKETEQALRKTKNELKAEKLRSTAADVGSSIMDGISSMIGTSKVKKQQQEIENLKSDNENLNQRIERLEQDKVTIQKEHNSVVDKLNQELKKIHDLFPKIKELLRIENLCKHLGFSDELTKLILKLKPVGFKGKLYSAEYKRDFQTDYSEALIKEHPTEEDKLQLTIDGVSDTNWFRQKYKEIQQAMGINIKQNEKSQTRGL